MNKGLRKYKGIEGSLMVTDHKTRMIGLIYKGKEVLTGEVHIEKTIDELQNMFELLVNTYMFKHK